jgi:nucleosome binding factor SPN SPT16 subunit
LQENRADIWDNANALAVVVGGTSDDLRYLKSISLHLWLFGYELPGRLQLLVPCMLSVGDDLLYIALLGDSVCTWALKRAAILLTG